MAYPFRRWDPLREMEHFRRDFDDLFDRVLAWRRDDIKGSYKNGVLELTAAVPKEVTARKVPIGIEEQKK